MNFHAAHPFHFLLIFVFGVFSDSVANSALHIAESSGPHSPATATIFAHMPITGAVETENFSGQFIKAQGATTITLLTQVDFVSVSSHGHNNSPHTYSNTVRTEGK
jgi:hypothetical protein